MPVGVTAGASVPQKQPDRQVCIHISCRSVLAEAVFKEVLSISSLNPLIRVDSASIGPSIGPGLHDPRVMWAAQKAGLTLSRRNIRPFDETADIVNYDLVLTMDHFDYEEVRKWVHLHLVNQSNTVTAVNLQCVGEKHCNSS